MAQPSVAREPSMEEILASIRQIIESNEPGAGKALSASLPAVYGADEDDRDSDIHLTVDQAYAGVEFPETMPQPDPRFVAANSAGSAPMLEAPARAMSLADVAARVRAASERNTVQLQREVPPGFRQQEMRTEVPAHMFEAPQPPVEMPRIVETAAAPIATPAPQAVAADKPVEPQYDLPAPAAMQLQEEFVQSAEMPAQIAFAAPLSDRLLPSIADDTQQALLSQDAGLQIARSFEELAAAIDGAERRSLDEIAEGMLRPMLRDWLDDNLPTLVERLVREEIERVARGPRR
jgi:cell pole-organizing protein PopZ